MAKRKEPDTPSKAASTPSKRSRKLIQDSTQDSPISTAKSSSLNKRSSETQGRTLEQDEEGSPIPTTDGKLFQKTSRNSRADKSARKNAGQVLVNGESDWEGANDLAQDILEGQRQVTDTIEVSTEPVTPSKRGRGRPKGAKNKRSPTPDGDHPPEERYFFQTRTGPTQYSSNSFSKLGLLDHEEYFDCMRYHKDSHEDEVAYLLKQQLRPFSQWHFELQEGFSICIYGYGSKRPLLNKFAEWLHTADPTCLIVVINGYTSKLNIRGVLNTISTSLPGASSKGLVGQPRDILESLLTQLEDSGKRLTILINSMDGPSLRRGPQQALFAALAAHEKVYFIATCDTPSFQLLWNSTLRDQFEFVYHDATTFASYDAESTPVDDVNELLGRKSRRIGGKEGIGFVLKSLPENARNLYRVLLTELLTILNNELEDDEEINAHNERDTGIEYRSLYQKASEDFICTSDMNFRFLLKEFHDHQMILSKKDSSGTETLGVPLTKSEMETVLEDLVID